MARVELGGLSVAYDVVGDRDGGDGPGRSWVVTPGGRFARDDPGVRELAAALADHGHRVLVWDRPNCGESEVCFRGESESAMQADVLAELLVHLDMAPAVIAGGSGGSRVSLLTAARHPEVAGGLAVWWITGGPFGLLSLATHYCAGSIRAAWTDGMAAVAALPEWAEVVDRYPPNRDRFLAQDRRAFIATLERWMVAYCPRDDQLVPGLPDDVARAIDVPALVFRSGESDAYHTRATSEQVAALLPRARLVDPPWGDREWIERGRARDSGEAPGLFVRWPLLAPQLHAWAEGSAFPDRWRGKRAGMERVSSKHGPRLDDEQKQEEHALLHGAPDDGRTEARSTEAPGDDEPSPGTRAPDES